MSDDIARGPKLPATPSTITVGKKRSLRGFKRVEVYLPVKEIINQVSAEK